MLNMPILKFEKSSNYLKNQLQTQTNNKQLILDIIAKVGLLNNSSNTDDNSYSSILEEANSYLKIISSNITSVEQLDLEINSITKELNELISQQSKASKTKEFYIAAFSNIKHNIVLYSEKFQALQEKIENDNKNFNDFINDNKFKYTFDSTNETENSNYEFKGFSVNEIEETEINSYDEATSVDSSSNNNNNNNISVEDKLEKLTSEFKEFKELLINISNNTNNAQIENEVLPKENIDNATKDLDASLMDSIEIDSESDVEKTTEETIISIDEEALGEHLLSEIDNLEDFDEDNNFDTNFENTEVSEKSLEMVEENVSNLDTPPIIHNINMDDVIITPKTIFNTDIFSSVYEDLGIDPEKDLDTSPEFFKLNSEDISSNLTEDIPEDQYLENSLEVEEELDNTTEDIAEIIENSTKEIKKVPEEITSKLPNDSETQSTEDNKETIIENNNVAEEIILDTNNNTTEETILDTNNNKSEVQKQSSVNLNDLFAEINLFNTNVDTSLLEESFSEINNTFNNFEDLLSNKTTDTIENDFSEELLSDLDISDFDLTDENIVNTEIIGELRTSESQTTDIDDIEVSIEPKNETIEENIETIDIEGSEILDDNLLFDFIENQNIQESQEKSEEITFQFVKNDEAPTQAEIEKKIQHILEAEADNSNLIISEKKQAIYLPYKVSELFSYIESYPNAYSSIQDVVKQEFILPLDYFEKHPYKSRYSETFNIIKNRERKNLFKATAYSLKVAKNSKVNPAIVAACRTKNELDTYLYYLNSNNLSKFKFFNIIYEVNPV